jgi:hypothetical protein
MSDIDTAAIVATVGTIAALVVIALFLRWCGRGGVKSIDSNRPRDYGPFIDRIKNMSDTGSGVTDEQMERIVSA